MPVEVPRKKALASSIERSEPGITIQQISIFSLFLEPVKTLENKGKWVDEKA